MPSKRSTSTSENDGSWHEVECTGSGVDGNGCIAWSSVWLPRKIPRNFLSRPFLCGFCADAEIERLKTDQGGVAHYSHLIEKDCLEQYRRKDTIRVFGVPEQQEEDPLKKSF